MGLGYNPYRGKDGKFTTGPSTVDKDQKIKDNNIKYDEDEAKRMNKKPLMQEHKDIVEALKDKKRYEQGSYDINTLEHKWIETGYQVTFWERGMKYSDEEYTTIFNDFLKHSQDKKAWAGAFDNEDGIRDPEVSFTFASKEQAIAMGRKYNQVSIWDNAESVEIKTGGTGIWEDKKGRK